MLVRRCCDHLRHTCCQDSELVMCPTRESSQRQSLHWFSPWTLPAEARGGQDAHTVPQIVWGCVQGHGDDTPQAASIRNARNDDNRVSTILSIAKLIRNIVVSTLAVRNPSKSLGHTRKQKIDDEAFFHGSPRFLRGVVDVPCMFALLNYDSAYI